MRNVRVVLYYTIFLYMATLLIGCGASKPLSALPTSREATCRESIEGKDYKYLSWGIGADNASAEEDALKAALWAAMVGGGAGNCVSLMNVSEREKNKDFVEQIFASGEWSSFVRSTNQGRIDPDKRIKMSNGKVKLGVEAIVSIKMLRETLEARGILGGMKIK